MQTDPIVPSNRPNWTRLMALPLFAMLVVAGCDGEIQVPAPDLRQETSKGELAGTVSLDRLGACAGVTVAVDGPGLSTVVTSATGGAFAVTGLAPGAYSVRIDAAGWAAFEEIFVYQAKQAKNLGELTLSMDTVPIQGEVELADGESPAGTAVEVSSEVELLAPDGVECGLQEASFLEGGSAVVDGDGSWESRVPRRSREIRGRTARPGYTRGEFTADGNDVAGATEDAPADVGSATLFPLTGFVNVVEGDMVNDPMVTLQISAFNASHVAISDVAGGTVCSAHGAFKEFNAELAYTLSGGDGERRICVTAINGAGDRAVFGRDVVVDTTPPAAPELLIGSGGPYLNRDTANVQLLSEETGTGLDRAFLSEDGGPAQERIYSPVLSHTFAGEGMHEITAVVRDGAGNTSPVGAAWVTVDTSAPAYSAGAAADGRTARITVVPTAAAGPTPWELRIGYARQGGGASLDLSQAPWQQLPGVAQGVPVTVTVSLPGADGIYTLQTQARDGAGNLSPAVDPPQNLAIDESPPEGLDFAIAEDAVTVTTITLELTADDALGAVTAQVAESLGFTSPTEYSFSGGSALRNYDLKETGEGLHTLYVRYCDAAGNCSDPLSDGVQLDATPPSSPFASHRGGAYATARLITLDLFASGADEVAIREGDAGFLPGDWRAYAPEHDLTLSDGDGAKTVYVGYRDLAGNTSAVTTFTVTLDSAAPTTPTVVLAGGAGTVADRQIQVALANYADASGLEMQVATGAGFSGAVWQAAATSFTYTLPAGDGMKTLYLQLRDAAGNLSGTGNDTVHLDTAAPDNAAFAIAGPSTVSETTLTLSLQASDGGSPVTARVAPDLGFTDPTEYTFTGSLNPAYALPSTEEGSHTVYVRYCDAAGNCTGALGDTVTLDRTPPSASVTIDGGDHTTDADVDLTLISDGADTMRIAGNAAMAGATAWLPYATAYSHGLTGGEGPAAVYVQFRDLAGNRVGPVSDTVTYDGTAPAAGTGITIDGGAGATIDRDVTVHLDVPADATEMILAADTGFSGASWQSTATSLGYRLSSGDGTKTLYAKWRDAAGNETGTQSDDIVLDTVAPTLGSPAIVLAGGADYTATDPIAVDLDATDAHRMQIDNDENFASPEWDTFFAATTSVAAPASDGTATWYVRFRDAAGNWTDARSDGVIVDRTAPELAALTVNDDGAWSTDGVVRVEALAADDSPLKRVELSTDGFATVAADRPYSPSFDHDLALAEGASATLSVRVVDAAGNASAALTAQTVTRDSTPPTPGSPAVRVAGGDFQTSRFVVVELAGGDAAEYRLANNAAFSGASWQAITDEVAWSLSSGDGPKDVWAEFRDAAGNVAGPFADATTLDTVPPTLGSFAIAEAPATAVTTWTVDMTGGGPGDRMEVSEQADFGSVTSGPVGDLEYALSDTAEGGHTLYGRICDPAGNCSGSGQQQRTLDTLAPFTGELAIDGGAAKTNDPAGSVTLGLFAADATGGSGIAGVRLGNSEAAAMAAPPEPYTRSKAWTLAGPHGPGTDADRTVWAIYHDAADNQGAPVSATIRLDRVGPAGTIAFADPATNQGLAAIDLSYAPDTVEMKLSTGSTCAGGSWTGVTDATLISLNQVDGIRWASVRFRDDVGNTGGCAAAAITMDTTGPTPQSMALTGNPGATTGYTNTPNLTLTAGATGATCTWEAAEDVGFIQPTATGAGCNLNQGYTLADGSDGEHAVYLRFADDLGNWGPVTAQSVVLDQVAPMASPGEAIAVAEGDETADPTVTLALSASDAASMAVTQSVSCGSIWEPYVSDREWSLTGTDGAKDLAVRFRDKAGNQTACFTTQVTLDSTIQGFAVALTGGDGRIGTTASQAVTVTLTGVDTADVTDMRVSNLSTFSGSTWEPLNRVFDWVLPTGDGMRTVYVTLRDAAGNTVEASHSITVDTAAPAPPALQLTDVDGDGYGADADAIELAWTSPADADSFLLQRFISGQDADFRPIATGSADPLTAAVPVTKPGSLYQFRVGALDAVGNFSGWSGVVEVQTFSPVTQISWIASPGSVVDYYLSFNSGVHSVKPTYTALNAGHEESVEQLPDNTLVWERAYGEEGDGFDEELRLRQANADGSMLIDSRFEPKWDRRRGIVAPIDENYRYYYGLASDLDPTDRNRAFLVYVDSSDIRFAVTDLVDGTLIRDWRPRTDGLQYGVSADWGADGQLVVAYSHRESGQYRLRAYHYDPMAGAVTDDAAWSEMAISDLHPDRTFTPSVAMAEAGTAYVAYFGDTEEHLVVADNSSGSFVTEVVDAVSTPTGIHPSIQHRTTDDTLHVAYYGYTDSSLRYALRKNGTWTVRWLENVGAVLGYAWDYHWGLGTIDLQLDPNGKPMVAFGSNGTARQIYFRDVTTGTATQIDTAEASFPKFRDGGTGRSLTYRRTESGDLVQATYDPTDPFGTGWSTEVIDTLGSKGFWPHTHVDGQGRWQTFHIGNDGVESGVHQWSRRPEPSLETAIPAMRPLYGRTLDIAVDENGAMHAVATAGDGVGELIAYAHDTTGVWEAGFLTSLPGELGDLPVARVLIDADDRPLVAFIRDDTSELWTGQPTTAGTWTWSQTALPTSVDTSGTVAWMDLARDSTGEIDLVYFAARSGDGETGLWYAHHNGTSWTFETDFFAAVNDADPNLRLHNHEDNLMVLGFYRPAGGAWTDAPRTHSGFAEAYGLSQDTGDILVFAQVGLDEGRLYRYRPGTGWLANGSDPEFTYVSSNISLSSVAEEDGCTRLAIADFGRNDTMLTQNCGEGFNTPARLSGTDKYSGAPFFIDDFGPEPAIGFVENDTAGSFDEFHILRRAMGRLPAVATQPVAPLEP